MDSYFHECRSQKLTIPTTQSSMTSVPSIPTSQLQIIFNFSGTHKYRQWILPPNSTGLLPAGEVCCPLHRKSIRFDLQITPSPKEKMFHVLCKGLRGFRLPGALREELAKYAVQTAWIIIVGSMSPPNNQLNVDFDFAVVHKHVFHEDLDDDDVIEESMENAGPTMIPASKASIEDLKSKIIDSDLKENNAASCSICLEDLEVGCEGVSMPCSHMFHGDCIKRWLRTSHYCPICRFQMPTN